MTKGTQEKFDLLTSKPQEAGQGELTYVKMWQRREMLLHAGTAVSDEILRQFIEDCVSHLRITIFKTRVSEQLRVQFPPPCRVTWKDLEPTTVDETGARLDREGDGAREASYV
ncbi:hypothetical protein CYMTET_35149 [Cymbomonas tetramitiformis]|uniref:Uncharacterized protein n=1 Tax=Cymbomonas tetramitiformis TaxID=36881 RepID=A0AAE0F9T0_9CHLO|nr:hypothetical protein CYMTET_35149 [Cymbomonas tetramitiformis]